MYQNDRKAQRSNYKKRNRRKELMQIKTIKI